MKNKIKKSQAFTIIELIIVVVIVGVLATIVFITYKNVNKRATEAGLSSDLNRSKKLLEIFRVENGERYPDSIRCDISDSATNKCIKPSLSGSDFYYVSDNLSNPSTFNLIIIKDDIGYEISNNSDISAISIVVGSVVAPIASSNTTGSDTTFSWTAADCTFGTHARYQYRYTVSSGYDSGLLSTLNTSVSFSTAVEGYLYSVQVQAQCYNSIASGDWSSFATIGYFRPYTYIAAQSYSTSGTYIVPAGVNQITALIASGGGGGGGGGYNSGWAISSAGGGGGGSGSTIANISVTPGQQLAIVVGTGGAGGLSSNNNSGQTAGSNGTNSSVGSVVVAGGGGGAYGNGTTAGAGGAGGAVTGGTYNLVNNGYIGGWIEAAGGVGASSLFGKGGGNGVTAGVGAGGWGGQNNGSGSRGGDGRVVILASTSQTHGSQSYSTSNTYTVPAGVNQVTALIASGGGGGGCGGYNSSWVISSGGGGGGGSGSTIANISVTPGQQLPIAVGTGGAGGTSTGNNSNLTSGANGTSSSVGSVVVAGGSGGTYGNAATAGIGGSGGSVTGGIYNMVNSGYVGGWIEAAGGVGASSLFGKGGGNGVPVGVGAGGWGGQNNGAGSRGGDGMVVIFW